MNRARLLWVACGLVVAGLVGVAVTPSSGDDADVELTARQHGTPPTTEDLPGLFVPADEPTTTTTVAPPSTVRPVLYVVPA